MASLKNQMNYSLENSDSKKKKTKAARAEFREEKTQCCEL